MLFSLTTSKALVTSNDALFTSSLWANKECFFLTTSKALVTSSYALVTSSLWANKECFFSYY